MPSRSAVSSTFTSDSSSRQRTGKASKALHEAIEAERARLMDADAILHCVLLALDAREGADPDEPHYQSAIAAARERILSAINHLDSTALRAAFSKDAVREPAALYLH